MRRKNLLGDLDDVLSGMMVLSVFRYAYKNDPEATVRIGMSARSTEYFLGICIYRTGFLILFDGLFKYVSFGTGIQELYRKHTALLTISFVPGSIGS